MLSALPGLEDRSVRVVMQAKPGGEAVVTAPPSLCLSAENRNSLQAASGIIALPSPVRSPSPDFAFGFAVPSPALPAPLGRATPRLPRWGQGRRVAMRTDTCLQIPLAEASTCLAASICGKRRKKARAFGVRWQVLPGTPTPLWLEHRQAASCGRDPKRRRRRFAALPPHSK